MQKISIFIVIHFFILLIPVYSQDTLSDNDVITSIEITGLKRTKPRIAEHLLEKFLGLERSAFNENEIFSAVKKTGVLEPVSAELAESEDGLVLRLTVEEKWSVFPVPLFFTGSGNTIYGIFLFDANAFGILDSIAAGGMFSSDNWSVIAMYNHTPNHQGEPGLIGFFMYGNHKNKNVDNYDRTLSTYTAERLRFSAGLNYTFLDLITSSLRFSFTNISLFDDSDSFNAPEDGAMLIGFCPGISLSSGSWDGFFLSEKNASLNYSYYLAITGSSYHEAEYRVNFNQPLVPGFRLNVRGGGIWKSTSNTLFEDGPQTAQVNILPGNYSALYYAGLSAGLEKYIYKNKWGTLSIQGAWQGVFSGSDISNMEFNHGPFAGMVFYLSRIALPALGSGFAYNMTTGLYQFNFSLGMSF